MCVGLFCVEVFPSPKSHCHEVGEPLLVSVNVTFNDAFPESVEPQKSATGACEVVVTVIYFDFVAVLLPATFVTVSLTVYFPVLEYLCVGFWDVDDVPSPKSHFHLVGFPVLLSVNLTLKGAFPYFGDE